MYAELECKTNFSFLRGASHPEELIQQADQLGLPAIAITDRDGVYGIPKAYWKKKNYPHLKLIVGAELTIKGHPHLTLLAQTKRGYSLLCQIITESHRDRPKGEPLLNLFSLQRLTGTSEKLDLVALATEHSHLDFLKNIFKENLYLKISRYKNGLCQKQTQEILKKSKEHQIPIVATGNVHYHTRDRYRLQNVLTCIREKTTLQKAGFHLSSNSEYYLKSPDEMKHLFRDLPEAIENSLKIAQSCTFCPSELRYQYPSEWIPKGHSAQSYLEAISWEGAKTRYRDKIPIKVKQQIQHELGLIRELQYADYFLTIYEIVDFATKNKILCQGRGSAANSIICYCLGITAIDPIQMNLLFERFISAERNEPPDIDVDFEHERREEVIQHIYQKYGRHRAAMVSTVVTYQKRMNLREISKTLGIPVGTLSAKKLQKKLPELTAQSKVPNCQEWIENLSEEMTGFPRHLSIHSGGFTLSAGPITDIVPVEPARMEGRTVIQWDKYDLDYLGLLKVDILALGMLSALRKSLDLIDLKLYEIPSDDRKTYQMIQKAETVGTFQIESRAQMSMLGRLQPKNFYDLVVQVAIVRPGPIVGKMVHPYLRRRRGEETVSYPHPKLKKILGKTLGVPLFQEQVMKIAIELGGFTPGESDELRRAIGAWRAKGSIERLGKKLIQGLLKQGLPKEFAQRIFDQIQGFSQYGFPESHAASFAYLAYASAYLKCHHTAEFTCSMINSQPLGFYSTHTLMNEAKRSGVKFYPVHPNKSDWDCRIENKGVRLGWKVVKGLSQEQVHPILSKRPFHSLEDFLRRCELSPKVLYRLAMGNVFSCFDFNQRESLWKILGEKVLQSDQMSLFQSQDQLQNLEFFEKMDLYETICEDYDAFRLSTHGHPMVAIRKELSIPYRTTFEAKRCPLHSIITVAGLTLIRQRPPTAKGVTFATLEDEFGFLDLVFYPDVSKKYKEVFLFECFLTVTGKLQRDGHSVSLLVQKVSPLWPSKDTERHLTIEPRQYFW